VSENAPIFDPQLRADPFRFAIIVSRFNGFVTDRLLDGALEALAQAGADAGSVDVFRIPGAWEFSVTAKAVAAIGRLSPGKSYDGIVCLGAVIRGDTPHFDYVAGEAARGIAAASDEYGVPIAFGVLTTNTVEQATDRAGGKAGNKGFEAAMTTIEMVHLLRKLRQA
jgi:6,7-dimethyl-8-ribityllumazine synthase